MRLAISEKPVYLVIVAALCAAGTWVYASRVLVPHQKSDAAAHERPRGNLSDLYPRWVGAKELLLNGRDPYDPEVSREIQSGYYGRPLDPSRPNDPRDEQGFAYPVYVVFLLAPTVELPFAIVQMGFFWVMLVLTCVGTLLWIRILGWAPARWAQISLVILTLGSLSVMQGLKLQQMSLLVAGLVAVAMAFLAADHLVAAGILLAVASIKPQLILLLLLWLAIWTLADWRCRFRLPVAFVTAMAVLTAASEWYLPHWIPRFWHAVVEYQRYSGTMSVIGTLSGGRPWDRVLEILTCAIFLWVCWRERRRAATSGAFGFMLSLVLATTILVAPTYRPYNQVFLIPALLVLIKDWRMIWQRGVANRFFFALIAGLILWPWISSTTLAALSFVLPQATLERAWALPLWTLNQIPVGVAGLMLLHYYHYQRTFAAPARPGSS
jgi:Glycosyltransferase family 87